MKTPILLAVLILGAGASPAFAIDIFSTTETQEYCSKNWKDSTKACLEAFKYAQAIENAQYLKDVPKQPKGFIKYLPQDAKQALLEKQDWLLDNHTSRLLTAMA